MKKNPSLSLALFGGNPIRKKTFASRPHISNEEKKAFLACLDNLEFSRFIGSPTQNVRKEIQMTSREALRIKEFWSFMGGRNVRKFEALWAKYHQTPYAISVNSATSGLTTALLAAGIQPGDEVITSPFSFTATATSIVAAQAVPVFADVDLDTFCLSPSAVKEKITRRTAAIMPVHILGNAGDFDGIKKISKSNGLLLIEDAAQAPGTKFRGRYLGSHGHAGVFSFQETKNVMTGEGGMIITNNVHIAEKCRLLRNHGESIPSKQDSPDFGLNVVGHNFRLIEPAAALGWAQTNKLKFLNNIRRNNGFYLRKHLARVAGEYLKPQKLTHPESYYPYCLGFRWDPVSSGISRTLLVEALRSEGIPVATGYPRLMSENILFTKKNAYGSNHWPFSSIPGRNLDYGDGRKGLPNALRLQYHEYIGFFQVGWPNTVTDMDDIVRAFEKILANKSLLVLANKTYQSKTVGFASGRR